MPRPGEDQTQTGGVVQDLSPRVASSSALRPYGGLRCVETQTVTIETFKTHRIASLGLSVRF